MITFATTDSTSRLPTFPYFIDDPQFISVIILFNGGNVTDSKFLLWLWNKYTEFAIGVVPSGNSIGKSIRRNNNNNNFNNNNKRKVKYDIKYYIEIPEEFLYISWCFCGIGKIKDKP